MCPRPLRERAAAAFQNQRMGEGCTPLPTECVDDLSMPSPSRGEGAATSAAKRAFTRRNGLNPSRALLPPYRRQTNPAKITGRDDAKR